MPRKAYTVKKKKCHFKVTFHFVVFLSARFQKAEGLDKWSHYISRTRHEIQSLRERFHAFFNPHYLKKRTFQPYFFYRECCWVNFDIKLYPPSPELAFARGLKNKRRLLPPGRGIIVLDRLGLAGKPSHAYIGGDYMRIDKDIDHDGLAHELGHILGLLDDYRPGFKTAGGTRVIMKNLTPKQWKIHEKKHAGCLMGKKKRGKREISYHEMQEIAQRLQINCDVEHCCPEYTTAR